MLRMKKSEELWNEIENRREGDITALESEMGEEYYELFKKQTVEKIEKHANYPNMLYVEALRIFVDDFNKLPW